jgi:alkylation response protein AidB-like acyl-CoA dehydrogenase
MDFNFSEEQTALQELAREILDKEMNADLLKEIEAGSEWFAADLWSRLAEANLLGLAVPEEFGGMGFGILELCLLLREIGRVVAPLPALPTLVLGGLPIAELGSDAQKQRWLEPVAAGRTLLSGALVDAGSSDPTAPATRARREDKGWVLDGRKRFVSFAHRAERVLVPAATDAGVGIFLLDPTADGVERTRQEISTGEPLFELTLAGVRAGEDELLGDDAAGGGAAASWMRDCAIVAASATQIGVSEKSLEITTGYVSEREQFGAPIGSFPPVQQRAADGYIDLECLRWTTWSAAWRLSQGLPASREAMVAKFWAAESGSRIANTAQHLHGGMGADRDYPIHRYLLWSKSLELQLGAAPSQLERLGSEMARSGPEELS